MAKRQSVLLPWLARLDQFNLVQNARLVMLVPRSRWLCFLLAVAEILM